MRWVSHLGFRMYTLGFRAPLNSQTARARVLGRVYGLVGFELTLHCQDFQV